MFRHYSSIRVPFFVGITLVALTAGAIASMNLNNVSKAKPESESMPLIAQAAFRPPMIEARSLQGFSFDFGTKYAVGYYQQVNQDCKVVLSYAEPINWDDIASLVATRFEIMLPADDTTRHSSHEGAVIQFTCQTGARSLTVQALPKNASVNTEQFF